MKLTHRIIHLDTIDSTNRYLREMDCPAEEDLLVCVADYQTAGRGQGTNTWESEKGKNLLFSVLAKPVDIAPTRQFILSEACALALKDVLDRSVDDITLKWPNDIYWQDCKLSGTLIETSLSGGRIRHCIFGVGLNVNQREFKSDAPNPVSLWQIVQHETDREHLLEQIICQLRASGHNLTKTNPIPYNMSFFLPNRPLGHHWTFVQKTDRPSSASPSLRWH